MEDVILYPAGGAFNKLRPKQTFLESLLQKNWAGYSTAPAHEKKAFVLDNIFNPIRASGRVLKIFKGKHPSRGRLVEPKEDEAYERLAQKLRDMKKRNTVRNPKRIYKKRKTSKSTSFDEYEGKTFIRHCALKSSLNSTKNTSFCTRRRLG